ncbi:MAG: hypothetical protein RLZZ252_401 [Bacteroidota bacterium]
MHILVLGAGRSAGYLIEYLAVKCDDRGWYMTVCDQDFTRLQHSFALNDRVTLKQVDVTDEQILQSIIGEHHVVVSLLPPFLHVIVAKLAINSGVSVFTASYISEEMRGLDALAKEKGVLLMNEMGLDPGIDHLSANAILDSIDHENKGLPPDERWKIISFESHCGGLVYQEDCTENPWGYKFSWNPTNVILAGQGSDSIYREEGRVVKISPLELFEKAESISISGIGEFDVYANRDSLGYSAIYGLDATDKLLRGTLRRSGYCKAWQQLILANLTSTDICFPDYVDSAQKAFLYVTGFENKKMWVEYLVKEYAIDTAVLDKLDWLPLGENDFWFAKVESDPRWFKGKTAAQFLERLLLVCWKLNEHDRDEVVMHHRFALVNDKGNKKIITSSLQVVGEGGDRTAMSKTVGLPLAIGLVAYLDGDQTEAGVAIPWGKRWYSIVLKELERFGVCFSEKVVKGIVED